MIPVGNWEDRIDELENDVADLEDERDDLQLTNDYLVDENAELQSALNAADTDIADYLFELDHLREKCSEAELDAEALLLLVEYWQGKAVEAADDLSILKNGYNELYADFAKTSRELSQIHGEVAPGRPGSTIDLVREMVSELGEVRNESARYQFEVRELAAENLQLQREANEEWERANNLETYSISIEESRELTNRNMDLELNLRDAEQEIETLQAEKRHDAIAYLTIDGESLENYTRVNELTKELAELKAALRTLGGEKEN